MPKITVIVPYNRQEKYIRETVLSLKKQTFKDCEFIFVNNACSDHSETAAREAAQGDDRFIFITELKKGIDHALFAGVKESRGEFISFLDADDLYTEDRLEKMLKEMVFKNLDFAACRCSYLDQEGKIYAFQNIYYFNPCNYYKMALLRNYVVTMSLILMRKEALLALLPIPESRNQQPDYYLLMAALEKNQKIGLMDDVLVGKRMHGENAGLNYFNMNLQTIPFLIERIPQFRNIFSVKVGEYLITHHYLDAIQFARRNGKSKDILHYLEACVCKGGIKKEFYFYYNFAVLYLLEDASIRDFLKSNRIKHPLFSFAKGLIFYREKEYGKAVHFFEDAFQGGAEKFPEAMNSLALACYFENKAKSLEMMKSLVQEVPDYGDALSNLENIEKDRPSLFKHTLFLTPKTLEWFLTLY